MGRRAQARDARLASLVRRTLRATDVLSPRLLANVLDAAAAPKELRRFVGQHAGALEAFAKRRFARRVTDREAFLAPTLGERFLVVEETRLPDGNSAVAAYRGAAGFYDAACLSFFAGAVVGADLDGLATRDFLLASDQTDAQSHETADDTAPHHVLVLQKDERHGKERAGEPRES
jgi:hypothetical protein